MQSFGGTSQPRHQAIGGRIKRELNIEPVCLRRGIEREFYPVATRYAPSTRSEEHTSELQSLMRISYAVFCLKKKKHYQQSRHSNTYLTHISNIIRLNRH